MTKEQRINKLKKLMINEIQNLTSETKIASIYAETMACMKCPLQLQCNRHIKCSQNIIVLIARGVYNDDVILGGATDVNNSN